MSKSKKYNKEEKFEAKETEEICDVLVTAISIRKNDLQ